MHPLPEAPAFHLSDRQLLALHTGTGMILTRAAARLAGQDTANRQMRKAGRKAWNEDDADVAAEVTTRLMILGGFLPASCYEAHGFGPFPYAMRSDGQWIAAQVPA